MEINETLKYIAPIFNRYWNRGKRRDENGMFFKDKFSLLKKGKKTKKDFSILEEDVMPNPIAESDISILEGDAKLQPMDKTDFLWSQTGSKKDMLEFEKAVRIEYSSYSKGIHDCTYIVRGRKFKDLSCMMGETVMEIDDKYEVRAYPDGRKFIFHGSTKPTFDDGDREWDHWGALAVYADENGINLIYCSYGYKIPRIDIYLGLKRTGTFFLQFMEYLQCDGFGIQIDT